MNQEQAINAIAREAVNQALEVIDNAYLLHGHSSGVLGDSLGLVLERQVKAALFAFEEGLAEAPAFANASRLKGTVVFHDGDGQAWQFLQLGGNQVYCHWSVATRPYPGVAPFLTCCTCRLPVDVSTPNALFDAFHEQVAAGEQY